MHRSGQGLAEAVKQLQHALTGLLAPVRGIWS